MRRFTNHLKTLRRVSRQGGLLVWSLTPDETLEQVTERVVGALPRVQAIEALHGYQNMKWDDGTTLHPS